MAQPLQQVLDPILQSGSTEPWQEPSLEEQLSTYAERGEFLPQVNTGIDTDQKRRQRFAASMILKGHTTSETAALVAERFKVSSVTANSDIKKLKAAARLHTNDDAAMDVIVSELTKHAVQRARYFHREAMAPLPDDLMLTPQAVGQLQRARVEASKEARASAEFVVNVFGRTSTRWSSKAQVDVVPLSGGTPEQVAAVNKLLGIETTRDVIDVTSSVEEHNE